MKTNQTLRDTAWVAKRLGVSKSTVEKGRAAGNAHLPPFIRIRNAVRYDESAVEAWIQNASQQA